MIKKMLEMYFNYYYMFYYNLERLNNLSFTPGEKETINNANKLYVNKISVLKEVFENCASYSTTSKLPELRNKAAKQAKVNFNKNYNF